VLTPIFDPSFSDASFGFRPGRSAYDAVYRTRETIRKGYRIAVDLELSKFFDTVDHDVLMQRVARKVRDHWLRRRLRMCYWKRWRRARTKVRELLKLGTSLSASISVAMSRKGPWRLARTLATQTGMTNKWLKAQGLLSVKELWVEIHYPATAR
jgi:hypothetical protein